MNISLTSALESFIKAKVSSGMYNNASEVVREALRLMEEKDQIKLLKIEIMKQELAQGLKSLDREEYSRRDVGEIADDVLRKYQSE